MENKGSDAELLYVAEGRGFYQELTDRFCILPNIPGQKYTFGSTFTAREEHGEFIFLSQRQFDALEEAEGVNFDSVFEITCDADNSFWAEPLGGNLLFINKEETETRKRLRYGDVLSLAESNPLKPTRDRPIYLYEREPTSLIFHQRKIPEESHVYFGLGDEDEDEEDEDEEDEDEKEEEENDAVEVTAEGTWQNDQTYESDFVGNDLVLSHILSYLPISDLKDARLVSQRWSEEGFKILKKRCIVNFNFDRNSSSAEMMKFFRYGVEMGDARMPSWTFKLPVLFIEDDKDLSINNVAKGKPGDKFITDLDSFLDQKHIQHLKMLKFDGNGTSNLEFQQVIKILRKAAPFVQYLELDLFVSLDELAGIGLFPVLNFEKLEALTLSVSFNSYHCPEPLSGETVAWFESLIPSIHKVSTLYCSSQVESIYLRSLASFQNLEEIRLSRTAPEDMKWLLKFPRSLRSVKLNCLNMMEKNEDWILFEKLLLKYAKELQSLQFVLLPLQEDEPQRSIGIPNFNKLVSLGVGFYDVSGGDIYPTLTFDNPNSEVINYSVNFPALESLTVGPLLHVWNQGTRSYGSEALEIWEKYKSFFNMFFPIQDLGMCSTLRVLDVPFVSVDQGPTAFLRASELAATFPNVANPWSVRARDPVKVIEVKDAEAEGEADDSTTSSHV